MIEIVERADYPAVGVWNARVLPNVAARRIFGDPIGFEEARRLVRIAAEARRTRRLSLVSIREVSLIGIPLIGLRQEVTGVLIAAVQIEELPALYASLAGAFASWSEIVNGMAEIVLTARPSGRVDFWNSRWRDYSGIDEPPSLQGVFSALDPLDGPEFAKTWRAGIDGRRPFVARVRMRRADGQMRWHRLHAQPVLKERRITAKWLITATDIHDEVEARDRSERSERRLRFLSDAGRLLQHSLDVESIADAACRHANAWLSTEAAVMLVDAEEHEVTIAEPEGSTAQRLLRRIAAAPSPGGDARAELLRVQGRKFVWVTLRARGRQFGLLCAGFAPGADVAPEDISLFDEFGRRVAMALDNAMLYANERRIAAALQKMLLPPRLAQPYGVRIESAYLPRDDEARVGGDWYDAFELPDGLFAVSIGDVAGHGVQAAALMGSLRQSIRTAMLGGATIGAALSLANGIVRESDPDLATAFIGVVDPFAMTISYASAGHPAPLIAEGERVLPLESGGGVALGILEQASFRERVYKLPAHGALVLYTDGIVEYAHDLFAGQERLHRVISTWSRDGMREDATRLAGTILAGESRQDDVALLLVRFAPLREVDLELPAIPQQSVVARRTLQRFVRDQGIEQERAGEIILAGCEAINNAIEHAYCGLSGSVRVRARRDGATVVVEIWDKGRWRGEPADESRGRGMLIIGALADEVEIHRADDGTSVRLAFSLGEACSLVS